MVGQNLDHSLFYLVIRSKFTLALFTSEQFFPEVLFKLFHHEPLKNSMVYKRILDGSALLIQVLL